MFRVQLSPDHIVTVVQEGSFDPQALQQSLEEVKGSIARCTAGRPRLLADLRRVRGSAQPEEQQLAALIAHSLVEGLARIAHVVEDAQTLEQLRLLTQEAGIDHIARQFHDEDAARRWLSD